MNFLLGLLSQVPLYLVWFVGAMVAVTTWQRHPRVSALTLTAIVIQALTSLIARIVYHFLPPWLNNQGYTGDQMSAAFAAVGFLTSMGHAVGLALLLLAVFRWRPADPAANGNPFDR